MAKPLALPTVKPTLPISYCYNKTVTSFFSRFCCTRANFPIRPVGFDSSEKMEQKARTTATTRK